MRIVFVGVTLILLLALIILLQSQPLGRNTGRDTSETVEDVSHQLVSSEVGQQVATAASPKSSSNNNAVSPQSNCLAGQFVTDEQFQLYADTYINSLHDSGNESNALVYALYSDISIVGERLERLLDFETKFGGNPLVNKELITLCTVYENDRCNDVLVEKALATDLNNGAMWFEAVQYYASKNKDDEVKSAIEELGKTSFFNERQGQRLQVYQQAMQEAGNLDYLTNIYKAYNFESSRPAGWRSIFKWCANKAHQSNFKESCNSLGKNIVAMGKSLNIKLIGLALQEVEKQLNSEKEQIISLQKQRTKLHYDGFTKRELLTNPSEQTLRRWVNQIDAVGELELANLIIQQGDYQAPETCH